MKTSVMVLVVLLIVTGGVLAVMNNGCKTTHHSWCAPGHLSVIPQAKRGARENDRGPPIRPEKIVRQKSAKASRRAGVVAG
jgi:hypothetical protein